MMCAKIESFVCLFNQEGAENSRSGEFWFILRRGQGGYGRNKKRWNDHGRIGKLAEAFIKLNERAPCGEGAGQMNKPFKNQSHQLLSASLASSRAQLGTQSKRADAEKGGGRRMTTSCLGNYHHFWHELRGLLAASLLLLNSLLCWLMMKRVHAPTPLVGLWHNVLRIPRDPASWAG